MLILADADRLRIDLDQFGKRVLQPSRDRHRAAQRHVEIGQFLRGVSGSGVDRRAGLRHHDLVELGVGETFQQFDGELVGLARGGAVADGDQLDLVLAHQLGKDRQRLVPAPLRLVRIDRAGGNHLAGSVDHRDLDAVAEARIETERRPGAGRRGEQQVAQVLREHAHRFVFRGAAQAKPQIDRQRDENLGAPRPARGVDQPLVAGAALISDAVGAHDAQLVAADRRPRRRIVLLDGEIEDFLALATEQRHHPVRRHLGERLGEFEIVLELRAGFLLAVAHGGFQPAVGPQLLAQRADQVGVLGEALDQDRAGAVERRRSIGDILFGVDERRGACCRFVLRLREQEVGEGFKSGFLGDLRLGAALRLERQIDVFQPPLAVGRHDRRFQRGVELALFAHGIEDHLAALFQLAQIAQPFLQRAQLRVVERAGDFLPIAGDERHGGAAVEQVDRGGDLLFADAEFCGNAGLNGRKQSTGLVVRLNRRGDMGRAGLILQARIARSDDTGDGPRYVVDSVDFVRLVFAR